MKNIKITTIHLLAALSAGELITSGDINSTSVLWICYGIYRTLKMMFEND